MLRVAGEEQRFQVEDFDARERGKKIVPSRSLEVSVMRDCYRSLPVERNAVSG
jgi:hypothetical protein